MCTDLYACAFFLENITPQSLLERAVTTHTFSLDIFRAGAAVQLLGLSSRRGPHAAPAPAGQESPRLLSPALGTHTHRVRPQPPRAGSVPSSLKSLVISPLRIDVLSLMFSAP